MQARGDMARGFARMRQVPLAFFLLVTGCSSAPDLGTDAGTDLSQCFRPSDGGVFVTGLPAPIPGCAADAGATGELDLASLGWVREGGVLVVPPTAAAGTALPVVVVFHGAGGSGEQARARFGLEGPADGGAIFVYPNAAQGTWDIRAASVDGRRVDNLLRRLAESYCIDRERIYMAGFSAGAVFTLYLGCNVPDTFRGMAVVAGSNERFSLSCCHSAISGIFIHGTQDEAFPLEEGQRARNYTLRRDGCASSSIPDGSQCQAYSCPVPYSVDYCEWSGDHDVPPWAGSEISRFFAL